MRTITVYGIELQFDADQITSGRKWEQADQALELINLALQRDPYGLGARLETNKFYNVTIRTVKEESAK